MAQGPGPAVDLIEHAASIISASQQKPHTAPYHWAGALWDAGMLVAPGTPQADPGAPEATDRQAKLELAVERYLVDRLTAILRDPPKLSEQETRARALEAAATLIAPALADMSAAFKLPDIAEIGGGAMKLADRFAAYITDGSQP